MEIVPGVFLHRAPLGPNIPGFSFVKIRNANNEDILTWTCHIPRNGKENPRVPHDLADQSSFGWIICNGQEVLLKNGDEEYGYTAYPPPLRKIEKGSTSGVKRHGKRYSAKLRQEMRSSFQKRVQENGGRVPHSKTRESDATPYLRLLFPINTI